MRPGVVPAELWLVRHGETVGGSSTRLYGSTDVALSELGRRQMERVRRALDGLAFERVIASPLRRAREAAAIVHPASEPPLEVIAAFSEIDFGRWEGMTAEEVAAADPVEHGRWRGGELEWGFPGGETRDGFRRRIAAAARSELGAARGGRTLLVVHKGVIKVVLGTLLQQPAEVYSARPCELGSLHVVERTERGWREREVPPVAHLGDDRLPTSV